MYKWLKARLHPFYAPDGGADGGTTDKNGKSEPGGGETPPPDTTDYKALYMKLKLQFDKTASEVAELKKAQKANMSEQQLKDAENAEMEQRYKDLQNEVNEMKTATAFAKAGFDEKDYGDIAKKIVEVGGDKASELAETLIEFVKKANKTAVAIARNGAIKDGVVTPQTSTAEPSKTPYADMAIAAITQDKRVEEIKNKYR